MEPDHIEWLVLLVLGLVAGVGMLCVRTSTAEATSVATFFLGARLFQYRIVRAIGALLGFAFAIVGAAGLMGKLS